MINGGTKDLFNLLGDAVVLLDEDGETLDANEQVEDVISYDAQQVVGSPIKKFIQCGDKAILKKEIERVTSGITQRSEEIELRIVTPEGDSIWVEGCLASIPDGAASRCILRLRQIDDSMYQFEERGEKLKQYEELFQESDDVLWMFSADWEDLLFINEVYEEMWGQPISELEANPETFVEQIYPEHRGEVFRAMQRLSNGEDIELEYRINPDEDYEIWTWVKASPIFKDGEVVRVAGLSRDITDWKNRDRLAKAVDQVLRHQIRNRLTVILGYCEQLREMEDSSYLDEITENCHTLLDLQSKFREIIDITIEKNPQKEFNFSEQARKICQKVRREHPEAVIDIDAPPEVRVEAIDPLPRTVEELIQNAVNHSEIPDSEITVRIELDERTATLVVEDQNPKISDQEIQLIVGNRDINPLYHGTGLGLWLINLIVTRSNGRFGYEENEPRGNIFKIQLPLSPTTAD